jgi:hypothetical protein
MARKKKLNPIATAGVIAVAGVTGFLVWKFLIKPALNKKRGILPTGSETQEVDYVEVVNDNIA